MKNNFLNILIFSIVSQYVFFVDRSIWQILICLSSVMILELILELKSKKHQRLIIAFWDSLLISFCLLILIKNWSLWYYGVAGVAAVFARYFFIKKIPILYYNPLNFAIIMTLYLFPLETFNALSGGKFIFSTVPMMAFFLFGMFTAWRNKSWPVVFGYLVSIFTWAAIDTSFFHGIFNYWVGPEFGFINLIFAFMIIADTGFGVKAKVDQVVFGVLIAALKILLKKNEFYFPEHLSLFIVSTFLGIYKTSKLYYTNKDPIVSRV